MTTVLDFLSQRPIYGIDSASMNQWRVDCEKSWETNGSPDKVNLLQIYIQAYIDLATKSSQQIYSSNVWPLEQRKENVEKLLVRPQVEQRTESWYTEAQKMLTASQFSVILQAGLTRARLVMEKASGVIDTSQRRTVVRTMDLNPFTWGIRFEPVVRQIYCKLTDTDVKDMGRLKHRTDSKLAASPDGMVVSGPADRYGRFVEFKAPVTRKLINTIPKEYVTQMQIQMEVGDVEECDYLEVKFISAYAGKIPAHVDGKFYGEIYVIGIEDQPVRYEYSELNTMNIPPQMLDESETILETVQWYSNDYYLTTVGRSRSWFASVQPTIQSFWTDVESAKAGTFIMPESTRKRKEVLCRLVDDI